MDPSIAQSTDSELPPNITPPFSPETDRLLRKWLKLQIAQFYWGMASRVIIFLLVAASIIFSTFTLAPMIEKQLGAFQDIQSMLRTLPTGGMYPTAPVGQEELNGIIKNLKTDPDYQFSDFVDQE